MNNPEDTIKELQTLRHLTVPAAWATELRARVFSRIAALEAETTAAPLPSPLTITPSPWSLYRIGLASVFTVFLIVTVVTHDHLYAESLLINTRIHLTFSDHAAERSGVALAYLDHTSSRFASHDAVAQDYTYVVTALDTTHTTLEGLQLTGELGKYTQQECLTLYQQYDTSIDTLHTTLQQKLTDTSLSMEDRATLTDLLRRVDAAHERIQIRTNMYPAQQGHSIDHTT